MGDGAPPNAGNTESVAVSEDRPASSPAEIRALAEEAEAEAAAAEALAAAARARARAVQLRRQAGIADAEEKEAAERALPEEEATADEEEAAEEAEAAPPEAVGSAAESDSAGTEQTALAAGAEAEKPAQRRYRLSGRLRRPKWSTVAATLAVAIILAALAGNGYLIKYHHDTVERRDHAAEFAAAARQGVVRLLSVDFNNAKQNVQLVVDNATGTFKDEYLKTADDFVKVVEQAKVVAHGTVDQAAVDLDKMTDDSAVVLVVSRSEVTNAAGAKQDPRSYRMVVTVTRDGGQLKLSKVEFAP